MSDSLGNLKAYLGLDVAGLTSGLVNAESAMSRASKRIQQVGMNMTKMISLPLAALGGVFGKSAADFQTSMRKINTLVGLSSERINGMSKDVIALSNATGIASVNLADTLFVVTSAGQRGAEAMQILERSAKASALGLGEAKEVARTVTAVLNAYGKENYTAARATDVLVGIVREGNLVAEEISPVLGRVIGIASQLGISFEEVGASIATFTRLGVKSDEAVTGLRGIMNALLKPSEQGAAALQKVGSSFHELKTQIQNKGLATALIDLITKFKGNEEAISDIVPNVRALSALLGTAGVQASSYKEIMQKLTAPLSHVDDGMAAIAEDSGFRFNQRLQELKNAGMELGLIILPVFNKVLTAVSKVIKKFTSLSASTKSMILAVGFLAIAIGPLVAALGSIGVILTAIISPIGATITAVMALSAAIYYMYDNWEAVKERISDWSWWKEALTDMLKFFVDTNPFKTIIDGYNALKTAFGGDPIENPFDDLSNWLDTLTDNTTIYEHTFKDFGETVEGVSKKLKQLFGISNSIPNVLPVPEGSRVRSADYENLLAAMNMFGNGKMAPAGQILAPELPARLERVRTIFNTMIEPVNQLGTAIQNSLNSAFVELGQTLGDIFTGDAGANSFFQGIIGIIASFMKTFATALIAIGTAKIALETIWESGAGAVAAGVALLAASAVVNNLLKKGPQGLRSGGFVTEGGLFQLHRNEQVALPAGSAVTSSRMLGQNNNQTIHVTGVLEGYGDTLRAVIDEVVRRNKDIN